MVATKLRNGAGCDGSARLLQECPDRAHGRHLSVEAPQHFDEKYAGDVIREREVGARDDGLLSYALLLLTKAAADAQQHLQNVTRTLVGGFGKTGLYSVVLM
jgi:hypothetical protein